MICETALYESRSFDPHHNLAVEQVLLEGVREGQCILYLWQNQNTVVIGRNQNAWKECRVELLRQEGGTLARRLSGGGAVFHDLGNLNFTFLLPTEDYDLRRQQSVIKGACDRLGIPTELSGRNDILADGRKFSGNAFYHAGGRSYHHGTLMIDVDGEKMKRYLSPSAKKLAAKSVSSVRSRVVNLKTLNHTLTVDDMKKNLARSFSDVYGREPQVLSDNDLDQDRVGRLTEKNGSGDWLYGSRLPFTSTYSDRFNWGEVTIELQVSGGAVSGVRVYSDAMDWSIPGKLEEALSGCRFAASNLQQAVKSAGISDRMKDDLCGMLAEA